MADHDTHDHTGIPGVGAGGGAPTTTPYITTVADAGLSAEVPRPELDDFSLTGTTDVPFTSPTSDNGALTFLTDQTGVAKVVQSTEITTRRHAYVTSAIGTGDFDLRMRLAGHGITVPNSTASGPFFGLFVADSSLTASTRISIQVSGLTAATAGTPTLAIGVVGTAGSGNGISGGLLKLPMIHRIRRVGTAVTMFVSTDEGRIWQQCGSATSSLNIARVGLIAMGGSAGTQTSVYLVHWLRSF